MGLALKRQGWGLGWSTYCYARASQGVVCIAGPSFKKTLGIGLAQGDLLWSSDLASPHPFFLDDALYVVPRVANPNAFCRRVEPLTGKVIDEFSLGVTGSCTRLTVTPNQFYYRPGGGEGRTVYVDLAERQLATYEGVVPPGCFDGVVPANGRLYWMPLACDCWQVHGTFCMAPRQPLDVNEVPTDTHPWATPTSTTAATEEDWPMYRADAAGTATVPVVLSPRISTRWQRPVSGGALTAPICVQGRVFVGSEDGTVSALDAANGKVLWDVSSHGAVLHPPAYWQGRIVFGSCDGAMYSVDAANSRRLGRVDMAPEKRFVNIMDRFMSAWPLGGGVVVGDDGTAYAAAGSTAADGVVAASVDLSTGTYRWRQAYTPDRKEPALSFGVQGNLLLKNNTLYINGGAPTGIVALDARDGSQARIVAKLEAGMETFLEPDDRPLGAGPELFSHARARTTIFKRHQGRVYFRIGERHIALIDGRLFCSRDRQALDHLVDRVNEGPRTTQTALDIMKVSLEGSMLWAGTRHDVRGLAVGTNGLVVLYRDSVEGLSADGRSLWGVPLPAPPVRWGIALTARECVVTLTNGQVVCLTND
jgi:outer membrane protein assembly factor BamB